MYVNLSGLNILVTGASRGIGKAVATKMAEAGATIAIHYREKVQEAENLAHLLGHGSRPFHADLSKVGDAANLFDRVVMEMGQVDVLINNAGVAIPAPIDSKDEDWQESWDRTVMVNLTSAAVLCKKAVNHFLQRSSTGRIINISSRAAFRGDEPEYLAYAASKAGLVSLTQSIARGYGKNGVRAFVVAPGFVKTDMAKEFSRQYGDKHTNGDVALERLTEPRDLAPLITFIASGMVDHSTGSTFDINAGSYMH